MWTAPRALSWSGLQPASFCPSFPWWSGVEWRRTRSLTPEAPGLVRGSVVPLGVGVGGTVASGLSGLRRYKAAWPGGWSGGCGCGSGASGRARGDTGAGEGEGIPACLSLAERGLLVLLGKYYSRRTLKHQEISWTLGLFFSLQMDCLEACELDCAPLAAPGGAGNLGTRGPCCAPGASVESSLRI